MKKPKNILPEDRESENCVPEDCVPEDCVPEDESGNSGLTYKSELSYRCQYYLNYYRRVIGRYRYYARAWYRNWQAIKSELEQCQRELEQCRYAAQVPGIPEEPPPCVRANIDYENVFGQHTKLSDVIDTLEGVVEGIRELEPANKAQDFSDTLYDKLHSISDVASILEDAYRKFPGI